MSLEQSILETAKKIISESLTDERVSSARCIPLDSNEHYTSTVFTLEICLTHTSNPSGKKTFNLIAKVLQNRKDSYLQLAFEKEIEFYNSLAPIYNNIGDIHDKGKNLFPKYFGSNAPSISNELRVILLDNMQKIGYRVNNNRFLDSIHTKLVLEKMSYFHALGIALKAKNLKTFQEDFRNLVKPALLNENHKDKEDINIRLREELKNLLRRLPELEKFTTRVDDLLIRINNMKIPEPKEPYSTLIHNDLWKNNIIFKYQQSEKSVTNEIPEDLVFIDFQFVLYNSPIRDLTYFVFSSTTYLMQKDFRNLSMLYYENLINNLEKLDCDTSEFTKISFIREVDEYAPTKFKYLILLMKKTPDTFEERLKNLISCYAEFGWL